MDRNLHRSSKDLPATGSRAGKSRCGSLSEQKLDLVPLTLAEANELVKLLHRHHKPAVGHRFSIGVAVGESLVGAVIVGRPVARMIEHTYTAEVTRCVTDGTPNACSKLYAAAWRAWKAMGGRRLITYTLADEEPGTSLIATGFHEVHRTRNAPKGWDVPSRPRFSGPQAPKTLWEMVA